VPKDIEGIENRTITENQGRYPLNLPAKLAKELMGKVRMVYVFRKDQGKAVIVVTPMNPKPTNPKETAKHSKPKAVNGEDGA